MANIDKISLKVCGNPDANSGFQPMVIFNSPSFEIKDSVPAGFDANSYFFTIKIEKNQVVYKLFKNNVSSLGASRQGSLVIGIAIPKGYKLDFGVSPYKVLMDLKKAFLTRCMTCKDQASEKYEFNSNRVSPTILDDVASSYSLVPVQMPYRSMSVGAPVAYVIATDDKIEQLMLDVHYPVFTQYGEIVIAENGQNASYASIANLPIPRMPEFSVYEDGIPQPIVLSDPKQTYTATGKGDPRYYVNNSFSFTLEELMRGDFFPGVTVDRANEKIHISTKDLVKPLDRKVTVVFEPKESESFFFTNAKEWDLMYGNKKISLDNNFSFVLSGEDIKGLSSPCNFSIQMSRKDQYDATVSSVSLNEICVTAKKIRRVVPPIGSGKAGGGFVQTSSINACEVLLSLDQAYKSGHCSVKFYTSDEDLLQSTIVSFHKRNDGNHIAKVYVPKSWSGGNVEVRLKYKNEYWYSNNYLGRDINGVIELCDKDFSRKTIGFFSKHLRGIVISILMLLSLLAGAIVGAYIAKNYLGSCDKQDEVCSKFYSTEGNANSESENNDTLKKESDNQKEIGSDSIESPESNKKLGSGRELAEHTATEPDKHNQDEHNTITCEICNEKFNSKQKYNKHKNEKHHFVCKECSPDVYFNSEKELNEHKTRKHQR